MDKLIEVNNLKTYFHTEAGVAKAVDDVSFDIYKGEVLGIVGESGSGKSVTSLSINRLIPNPPGEIVGGKIIYKDIDLLSLSHEKMRELRGQDIAMIFQEPMTSLNPVTKIRVQMNEILMQHKGLSEEEATNKSITMLGSVGILEPEKRINDYPHQFSGGMRQRVMIAMALQCNPALLIADEPTTALDVTIQAQILDLMMTLKEKREDAAILLITHDLAVIAETCDRVIVMYGGKIQEIATIDELFNNPLHPYTKALMQSIPKLDKKKKRLKTLKGMVPSILELGDGCKLCSRFDPMDCACGGTGIEPELLEYKDNHLVRCNPDIL
jgi:oligopeptide/dipeptide ABC transporter ATP-binding protein|tara:strand:+ start:450 stop:1427 length:978 start_codon:yes stop_codon:yes gene_type:complete